MKDPALEKAELIQGLSDWEDTFSTPHGRRVLLEIALNGHLDESIFTGNSTTYLNAGKQDFARWILHSAARACPEAYEWVHKVLANRQKNAIDQKIDALNNRIGV